MFLRVYGEPVEYHLRPTGYYGLRTSTKLKRYKISLVEQLWFCICQGGCQEDLPLLGPLKLDLWIFRTRPRTVKSMYPDKRPDRDNLEKPAIDALTKAGIIQDDDCIVSGPVEKRWAGINYPDCGIQQAGVVYQLSPMPEIASTTLNSDYAGLQGVMGSIDMDLLRSDREEAMREFLSSGQKQQFDMALITDYFAEV